MDQERGERYEYVADINAVLGADGRDIATGYSFLFGGRGDTGSYILRGSRELAKNPAVVLPRSSSIHRRWFHLKMRKDSGHLALWVDGELVAAADDPDPLPGRHLGLWTWDNGVMIAHVRVSTDGAMVPESTVQSQPPVPRTPYDEK
jgi:hypothetical protein